MSVVNILKSQKKKRGIFAQKGPILAQKHRISPRYIVNFFLFIYNIVSDAIARGETFHSLQWNWRWHTRKIEKKEDCGATRPCFAAKNQISPRLAPNFVCDVRNCDGAHSARRSSRILQPNWRRHNRKVKKKGGFSRQTPYCLNILFTTIYTSKHMVLRLYMQTYQWETLNKTQDQYFLILNVSEYHIYVLQYYMPYKHKNSWRTVHLQKTKIPRHQETKTQMNDLLFNLLKMNSNANFLTFWHFSKLSLQIYVNLAFERRPIPANSWLYSQT